jgi:anti-sigma factor RsiW
MQFQHENPDELCTKLNDYLDGDLPPTDRAAFESHVVDCGSCRQEIEFHSRLENEIEHLPGIDISVPADFSKVVAAAAESQVAGLREQKERKTTVYIMAVLGAVLFFVLGANVSSIVALIQFLTEKVIAVFAVVASFIFNLLLGIFVIARVAVSRFEVSSTTLIGLGGIILAVIFLAYLFKPTRPSVIGEAKR